MIDNPGKIQDRDHETSTNPGPQNTISMGFQGMLHCADFTFAQIWLFAKIEVWKFVSLMLPYRERYHSIPSTAACSGKGFALPDSSEYE